MQQYNKLFLSKNSLKDQGFQEYQHQILTVSENNNFTKLLILFKGSSQVLQFDPENQTWSYIWPNMTFKHYNHGCTLFEHNGYPGMIRCFNVLKNDHLAISNIFNFQYCISLNSLRAYYYFSKALGAQTIQGGTLIHGLLYFLWINHS